MNKGRVFIAGLIIVLLVSVFWYKRTQKPVNRNDQTNVMVAIPTGASVSSIADILKEKGLIRSEFGFKLYSKFNKVGSSLKAGSFLLRPSQSVPEIIGILRQGFSEQAIITIPEGFTVQDIDALMAEKGFLKAGEVMECARTCDFSAFSFLPAMDGAADRAGKVEGFLFPDTYFVVRDTLTAKSFLERLLQTFEKRVVTDLADDIKASKRSLKDLVIMASLIEEETRTDDERPMVSGILWKRFDGNMGLGVDAALRYILNKPTSDITKTDLDSDSLYNLRKFRGLPPTPIANAGLSSIKAAMHPTASEYLYYLHGNDGKIRYAKNNDEHNENRALYLR